MYRYKFVNWGPEIIPEGRYLYFDTKQRYHFYKIVAIINGRLLYVYT